MTKKVLERLLHAIAAEGFEYFFCSYASLTKEWHGDDKELAKQWRAFVKARSGIEKRLDELCDGFGLDRGDYEG